MQYTSLNPDLSGPTHKIRITRDYWYTHTYTAFYPHFIRIWRKSGLNESGLTVVYWSVVQNPDPDVPFTGVWHWPRPLENLLQLNSFNERHVTGKWRHRRSRNRVGKLVF